MKLLQLPICAHARAHTHTHLVTTSVLVLFRKELVRIESKKALLRPKVSFVISRPNPCITIIQIYAPTSNAEEAEVERFYEDLQDLIELTPPKMFFSL